MEPLVVVEYFTWSEENFAFLACYTALLHMNVDMFFLVRTLVESDVAAFDWADVGSLTCMYPQMIKEIMPSLENFMAVWNITDESLGSPFRVVRASEPYEGEVSRTWYR